MSPAQWLSGELSPGKSADRVPFHALCRPPSSRVTYFLSFRFVLFPPCDKRKYNNNFIPLVSCAHRSFLLTAPTAARFLSKKKLPDASVSDYLLANASRVSRRVRTSLLSQNYILLPNSEVYCILNENKLSKFSKRWGYKCFSLPKNQRYKYFSPFS